MPIPYDIFMKHAEKVTKTASEFKPALHGVYHHEDGSLVVTDSFRLYKVFGVEHDKEPGTVYTPKGKKIDKSYPNIDRLTELPDNYQSFKFETKGFFQVVDLVTCVPITLKEKPVLYFEKDRLKCNFKSGERAIYYLPVEFKERFVLNGQFLLDALNLLKEAKCKEFTLLYQSPLRPVFLIADDITILILPMKECFDNENHIR